MAEIINLKQTPQAHHDGLQRLYNRFAREMKAVEAMMQNYMGSYVEVIPQMSAYIVRAGGKRLRPLLTVAAADLCAYQADHHIALGAAIEFLHTATLLHDDVVDESDLRRGLPTARKKWGNASSVLVGDFLLGRAFRMMVMCENIKALDIMAHAAATIAEGEVMQLGNAGNIDITEDMYLRVIKAKTATLFSAATQIGGIIATVDDAQTEALKSYGHNLGIAFQLVDDALDYGGLEQKLGKSVGDDLHEGKATLPLLLAYRRGTAEERGFWQSIIGKQNTPEILEQAIGYMHKYDALYDTVERARFYGERAKDALALCPQNETSALLADLVGFCIERAH